MKSGIKTQISPLVTIKSYMKTLLIIKNNNCVFNILNKKKSFKLLSTEKKPYKTNQITYVKNQI